MAHAVGVLRVSERRACRAIGQLRTTQRYCPQPDSEQDALRDRVVALAKEYGRYGYRTVTDLLRREGWDVGKDRVYTIWRREGLQVPQKQPKRARLWPGGSVRDSEVIAAADERDIAMVFSGVRHFRH